MNFHQKSFEYMLKLKASPSLQDQENNFYIKQKRENRKQRLFYSLSDIHKNTHSKLDNNLEIKNHINSHQQEILDQALKDLESKSKK